MARYNAEVLLPLLLQKLRDLQNQIEQVKGDIARVDAKLANADFVQRAPEEIVEGEREKREEAEGRRVKIVEALARLANASLQPRQ